MHYVYLLRSEMNGSVYVGATSDVRRRLDEHNAGRSASTRRFVPYVLLYYEAYIDASAAFEREKQLKRFGSAFAGLAKRLGLKEGMGA